MRLPSLSLRWMGHCIVLAATVVLAAACGGGGNAPPPTVLPASLTISSPARAEPAEAVSLGSNAGASEDLEFRWTFGDGGASSQRLPQHAYATPGNYLVTLTVRNGAGQSVSGQRNVQVGHFGMLSGKECSGPDHSGWCWQAPLPSAETVRVVRFSTADVGMVAGAFGYLQATADGGKTWTRLPRTDFPFQDVAMLDANNGWARSDNDLLLFRTRDGGKTWTRSAIVLPHQQIVPQGLSVLLPMGGDRLMIVPGATTPENRALLTLDGGGNWALVPRPTTPVSTTGVYWSALTNRLRGGGGEVTWYSRSSNFGLETTPIDALPSACAARIQRLTESRLVALCSTGNIYDLSSIRLFQSDDGGASWRDLPATLPEVTGASWRFTDVMLNEAGEGYGLLRDEPASGPRTRLLRASGGATQWREVVLPSNLSGLALPLNPIVDANTLWLVDWQGQAWWTEDGGQQWRAIVNPAEAQRPQRWMRDGGGSWLAEYFELPQTASRFYRTANQGRTWQRVPGDRGPTPHVSVNGLWFFDEQRGLALDSDGSLRSTSDGGRTWTRQPGFDIPPFASSGALQFNTPTQGWLIANDVLKTSTDAGQTWRAAERLPVDMAGVIDLQFTSAKQGWAVTLNGKLYKTADGGQRWTASPQPTGIVRMVRFFDEQVGVLQLQEAEYFDSVWHTTDGGQRWTRTNFTGHSGEELRALRYADARNVWMIGGSTWKERVWRSSDGGATWRVVDLGVPVGWRGIHFVDDRRGWLIGSEVILATQDGGENWAPQAQGALTVPATSMFWLDAHTGWIGGGSGAILATATGGR